MKERDGTGIYDGTGAASGRRRPGSACRGAKVWRRGRRRGLHLVLAAVAGVDPHVDGLAKELVNQGTDAEVLRDSGHGLALGSISSWPDISGPPCDSAAYGRTL